VACQYIRASSSNLSGEDEPNGIGDATLGAYGLETPAERAGPAGKPFRNTWSSQEFSSPDVFWYAAHKVRFGV
jgi:hypothetical protein